MTLTKVVKLSNEITGLIDAAREAEHKARAVGLASTAGQLDKIAAQLDVCRVVIAHDGDYLPIAKAYADVCADRIVVHAAFVGRHAHARR